MAFDLVLTGSGLQENLRLFRRPKHAPWSSISCIAARFGASRRKLSAQAIAPINVLPTWQPTPRFWSLTSRSWTYTLNKDLRLILGEFGWLSWTFLTCRCAPTSPRHTAACRWRLGLWASWIWCQNNTYGMRNLKILDTINIYGIASLKKEAFLMGEAYIF